MPYNTNDELTRWQRLVVKADQWAASHNLTSEHLNTYGRVCLPGSRFNRFYKIEGTYTRAVRRRVGRATREDLLLHLHRSRPLAVEWPHESRIFVLDLDRVLGASVSKELEFLQRIEAVRTAFDGELIIVRSSTSRGIHAYAHLDKRYGCHEIAHFVCDTLLRAGISLSPGRVELWPRTACPLRMPLGRGSTILDPDTLMPLAGRFTRGNRLLRDVPKAIELFAEMAAENARPLKDWARRPRARSKAPKSNPKTRNRGHIVERIEPLTSLATSNPSSPELLYGNDYKASIAAIEERGFSESHRNDELLKYVFDLRIVRGFPNERALAELADLVHRKEKLHTSKELRTNLRRGLRKIIRSAESYLRRLDALLTKGHLQPRHHHTIASDADLGYIDGLPLNNKEKQWMRELLICLSSHAAGGVIQRVLEIPRTLFEAVSSKTNASRLKKLAAHHFGLLQVGEYSTSPRPRHGPNGESRPVCRRYLVLYRLGVGLPPKWPQFAGETFLGAIHRLDYHVALVGDGSHAFWKRLSRPPKPERCRLDPVVCALESLLVLSERRSGPASINEIEALWFGRIEQLGMGTRDVSLTPGTLFSDPLTPSASNQDRMLLAVLKTGAAIE